MLLISAQKYDKNQMDQLKKFETIPVLSVNKRQHHTVLGAFLL
jgi:hypothetical protein